MLDRTYIGMPVYQRSRVDPGYFVGRIVGLEGSTANGGTLNSIVLFGTPHGTVLRTGIMWVYHIEPGSEHYDMLMKYEADAAEKVWEELKNASL